MKIKKLYFTISPDLEEIDEIFETNGNQTITCYSIQDNVPYHEFEFVTTIAGYDQEKIQDYLEENDLIFEDSEFEFIFL
jgi:hypothetical protein